jgi:outer membrane protein assembly factor BamB
LNQTADCLPDNVWQESVVAIDMESGDINWKKTVSPLDAWVMVCGFAGAPVSVSPLCPDRPGPDTDFGMAPTFVPAAYGDGTTGEDSIIIGQKSGEMYSFNAATGELNWKILTAPQEGTVGGPGAMSWGMASDDKTIFYTSINYGARNFTILDQQVVNNSVWGAANLKTGGLLWQVPVPDLQLAYTPPSIVGDLMFVGRSGSRTVENDDTNGQVTGAVVSLSKSTGATLREFPVSSIQRGGITIAGGFVIFGTGYHYQNRFQQGGLYVYGLPDAIELARLAPAVSVRRPTPATGQESDRPSSSGTVDAEPAASSTRPNGSSRMVASVLYPVLGLMAVVVWLG